MKRRIAAALLSALLVCACLGLPSAAQEAGSSEESPVKFHFLDVNSLNKGDGPIGSADCIIIEDHGKITMVDAGTPYDVSVQKILDYLDGLGVTKIDRLFLSHPHDDHGGGMPAVIEKYDIGTVYCKASDWDTLRDIEIEWRTREIYDDVLLAAQRKQNSDGSTVKIVHPETDGETVTVSADSSFEIWNCEAPWENKHYHPEFNDYTMVVKYTYKDVSALLMGDINRTYESSLLGHVGKCDIFKVAHHGTKGSVSSSALFDEINASVAVVTGLRANFNVGGAATDKVITEVLESRGISYKITEDGDVVVTTDGRTVSIAQTA